MYYNILDNVSTANNNNNIIVISEKLHENNISVGVLMANNYVLLFLHNCLKIIWVR